MHKVCKNYFIDKKFVIAAQLHRIDIFSKLICSSIHSRSSGCIVSFRFVALFFVLLSLKIFFPPFYGHLFFYNEPHRTQSCESFYIIDSVEMTFSHLHCVLSHLNGLNRKYYICYFKIIAKRETLARPTNIYWISKHWFYCICFASDAQIDSIYFILHDLIFWYTIYVHSIYYNYFSLYLLQVFLQLWFRP